MVEIRLEARVGEVLEARSVRGNNSYWSSPIAKNEKTSPIALNRTARDYTTTYGLREAIYKANK